ncbi:Na(+) H(+) antiporter subunit E [Caenispirillum salinarum AK4]|uniref:Na(+) H(+) antiporter subunit E n=1 Tax=Caenispirillum salinarum AK4 TaxID=1238182 RepID=K9GUD7_9PROT|nr:Na+/H+ antiporter subunit E [Caenispirillum salinarum]EKV29565.1 Na(+) H(+) antiporter subunit E [Caenispirillum salinarum AK4]
MTLFALNVVLAVLWVLLRGSFDLTDFATGFGLGFLVLSLAHPLYTRRGSTGYVDTPLRAGWLVLRFVWEVLRAATAVLVEVATRRRAAPGIIAVPLEARTNAEITLFANMITLTPGTVSLEVGLDRQVLYVHALFCRDPAAAKRAMKDSLERPALKVLR